MTPVVMDSWKILLLMFHLVYFWFVSFVAFVKSFLKDLGIITFNDNYVCYTTLTTLKARDSCLWYLDNGCSRHMTGYKASFKTLFEGKIGIVTFGDGSKSVIRGIGTVDIPRLPVFENVWYVDGLKTRHIDIRYHFIMDLVERKIVALEYIPTERQNVDIFTKPLDRSKFETLRQVIGVILCP